MTFTSRNLTSLSVIFSLLIFAPTLAQADSTPKNEAWESTMELGYVQTGGNTQVRSLNTKGKLIYNAEAFRTTVEGGALSTTDSNTTTAEKYNASLQEDWKITARDYMFARADFTTDRFSGYKRRISETLGYGRTLVKNDEVLWNMELGAGSRQSTLTNNTKKNKVIGRGSTNLDWNVGPTAKFSQLLKTEGGQDGFISHSESSLKNKINGNLSSKISYNMQHISKVTAPTKKLDSEISISLVWSY